MKEPRVSFESDFDEETDKMNTGLNLKPSSTRMRNKAVQQEFQERVQNTHKRLEGHLQEAYELGKEFTNLMADTRVPENIGPYDRSFEKEIVRKLINYAIRVNADGQEQEGMGSVSLITLMVKTMFKQRDKMNQMAFNNHRLERRIKALEKTILSSHTKAANEDE